MKEPLMGRTKIFTSCLPVQMQQRGFVGFTLNRDTLPNELNHALMIQAKNRIEMRRLLDIFRGKQDILKRSSEDRLVNNMIPIPYPNAFTRQIVDCTYSNGIQFVQNDEKFMNDVQKINRFLRAENKLSFDKIMADEQSIYGTHFRGIFPDTIMADESPLEIYALNPFDTFVAYSTYNGSRPVYACTTYKAKLKTGEERYIHQIYTACEKFTYNSSSNLCVRTEEFVSEEPHILGEIPIIEYPNNEFRLGDWELAVGLMDAINDLASDSVNDVEQCVKSYLALFGVEVDEERIKQMRKDGILAFPPIQGGGNQDAKFITAQLDGASADLLRTYLENALRVVVGIPDRNSSGGGDTGTAIQNKNGWREIDAVAKSKTMYTEMAERRFLKIVLNILSPKYISNEITPLDVDIKIPRNKMENFQSNTQAGSILYQMGVSKTDVASLMDITTDTEGFVRRWEQAEKEKLQSSDSDPVARGGHSFTQPVQTSESSGAE